MNRISTNIRNDQANAITRNLLRASRLGHHRKVDRLLATRSTTDDKRDPKNSWKRLEHRMRKLNSADGFKKLMARKI